MATDEPDDNLTRLLNEAREGEEASHEELFALIYDQLRRIAQRRMSEERVDHTLEATALVHETYLRLFGKIHSQGVTWADRSHFYKIAAEVMHRILIDEARKRGRIKRGGSRKRVTMDRLNLAHVMRDESHATEFLALDEALSRLKAHDERMHEVVMLRFFAGLSIEATAETLGVSPRTVKRDWTFARAWLYGALGDDRLGGD